MAELGRKFVLLGGTQHNLAAVKAQVDYFQERVPDAEVEVQSVTACLIWEGRYDTRKRMRLRERTADGTV